MSAETASYVTACACPDDMDQVVDVENVIFSQRCARCGGILSTEAGSVYQALTLLEAMRTDLRRILGTIDPPVPGSPRTRVRPSHSTDLDRSHRPPRHHRARRMTSAGPAKTA